MKYRGLLILAVASGVAATPASATDRRTRIVFDGYTDCVARQDPKMVRQIVLSNMKNQDIVKNFPLVLNYACLGDAPGLRLPGEFLRYGFAQMLIRREYSHGLPADIGQAAPLQHMEIDEADYLPKPGTKPTPDELKEVAAARRDAIGFRFLSIYSECVVRKDPAAALKLILTRSASKAETAAVAVLRPQLTTCLDAGHTLSFDISALRGSIAMNLYRLAKAPRIGPAALPK
jgi:hypothetical protein